jgi:hypothetical protein
LATASCGIFPTLYNFLLRWMIAASLSRRAQAEADVLAVHVASMSKPFGSLATLNAEMRLQEYGAKRPRQKSGLDGSQRP